MGICLSHIFSGHFPLHFVSEQVLTLPHKKDLPITSVGWPKIVYFFSGSTEMALDGGELYRIIPGDTVVLSGSHGQRYLAGASPSHARLHALIISFERPLGSPGGHPLLNWDMELTRYLAETFPANRHLSSNGSSALWDLAVRLRNACRTAASTQGELVSELSRLFVFRLAEFAGRQEGVALSKRSELAGRACDAAFSRSFEPVLRHQAADDLGVSIATLDRACRATLGIPYASYVDRLSVERAKSLLLNSTLSISGVAKELRFGSARHFCRAFKTATGLTPGEYQQGFQGASPYYKRALVRKNRKRRSARDRGFPEADTWEPIELPACLEVETPSLLIVLEGNCEASVGGVKRVLREEDLSVLLLPAGDKVQCEPLPSAAGKGSATVLLVRGSLNWRGSTAKEEAFFVALKREGGRLHDANDLPLLRGWMQKGASSSHASLLVRSLIGALWWEVLGTMQETSEPVSHSKARPMAHNHQLLISHAREFICKNGSNALTLGEIAWAVGVSEEHLARVFRAESGETVMAFRLRHRIHLAQGALVRTQKSIAEIAEACGFNSVAHFHRVFKKALNCTPGEFRLKGVGALP